MRLIITVGEADHKLCLFDKELSENQRRELILALTYGKKAELQIPSAIPKDWRPG